MLNKFIYPAIEKVNIDKLTAAHIESCLSHVNRAYAKKILAVAKAMLNYAVGKGMIDRNPCRGVELPREKQAPKNKDIYYLEEAADLFAKVRDQEWELGWIYMVFGGLRPKEATAQDKPAQDWDGYIIIDRAYSFDGKHYNMGPPKTHTSYRGDCRLSESNCDAS